MNVNKMNFINLMFTGLFFVRNICYLYIHDKVFVMGESTLNHWQ